MQPKLERIAFYGCRVSAIATMGYSYKSLQNATALVLAERDVSHSLRFALTVSHENTSYSDRITTFTASFEVKW
jgi:hypothetical protein